jgi:hypothetical protein
LAEQTSILLKKGIPKGMVKAEFKERHMSARQDIFPNVHISPEKSNYLSSRMVMRNEFVFLW